MEIETRFIPVTEWNKYHTWPPTGGLRHLRFFCRENGFEGVFVKVGRRLLVDEKRFFEVIESKRQEEMN